VKRLSFLTILMIILFTPFILTYGQSRQNLSPSPLPYLPHQQAQPVSPSTPSDAIKSNISQYSLNIVNFSASSTTVNYGDEVNLRWTIKGNNLTGLVLEITPNIGVIPLLRKDYRNESFTIEGSKTIKPVKSTKYILRITATDPFRIDVGKTGGVHQRIVETSKELFINVKKPKIENIKPSVDQKTMKIKFFAKNTGDGDFLSSPIQVKYNVINNLYGPSLASGRFTTSNLNIKQGEQVELGEMILTDRESALKGDGIVIGVDIEPIYKLPLEKDSDIYENKWTTEKLKIGNEILKIFGDLFSGSIRINNYYSGGCFAGTTTSEDSPYRTKKQQLTSEALPCLPGDPYFKQNDCFIKFPNLNYHQNFSIPRFELTKGRVFTYDYKGYVHNLNASWSGVDAFSISEGKINFNISFKTEGTEIKGYEYTQGNYYDFSAPDYDLKKFDIKVNLVPGLRNGKISYFDIQIFPEVKGGFVGGYQALPNSLEREIDEKMTKELSKKLKDLMLSDSIRGKIEETIEKAITKNPLFKIYRIVNVKGEGDNIVIEYIPR